MTELRLFAGILPLKDVVVPPCQPLVVDTETPRGRREHGMKRLDVATTAADITRDPPAPPPVKDPRAFSLALFLWRAELCLVGVEWCGSDRSNAAVSTMLHDPNANCTCRHPQTKTMAGQKRPPRPLVLVLLLAAACCGRTQAFTSMLHPVSSLTLTQRRISLLGPRSSSATTTTGFFGFANDGNDGANTNGAAVNDKMLKEFEKKEAAILQRKADAAAKLSKYEESLNELQNAKRAYMAQVISTPVGGSFSETAWRSAVKAFCWRLLAGSITFVTTLKFSGSVNQAIKVVGADFFSKSFTMFIGERLMNKSQAGRKRGGDNAGRSLAKALIWRLFAICNTLTMAIFIAKDLSIASKIASTDAVFKTALMYFYERVWARINWGKEYLIEFSI
jgi:uncharacterized membrane protein